MLPNLPLDVNNTQIRVGAKVVFGADNGSYLYVSEVYKITECFVWMKPIIKGHCNFRRNFSRVAVIKP